jgi:hypothetical protein
VPGESWAPEFGLRVVATAGEATSENFAILRVWKPGDRVRLRHTLKEQKVKEALQRLHAGAEEKSRWPVLLWEQRIVWMQGVEVQPTAGDPAFQVTRLS